MVTTAASPTLGARLASVRQSEIRLADASPRPLVVAALAIGQQPGASTLVAVLAQATAGLAPDRIAVLDTDGMQQPQRFRLGTGNGGSLRHLVTDANAWRFRRTVERYLAHGTGVPVLAAALTERGQPLAIDQLRAGLHVLRRRYPVVLVDVPGHASLDVLAWAVQAADHVIMVARDVTAAAPALPWLHGVRANRGPATVVIRSAEHTGAGFDVHLPNDPAFAGHGRVRLAELGWPALAAVERVSTRVAEPWRHAECERRP